MSFFVITRCHKLDHSSWRVYIVSLNLKIYNLFITCLSYLLYLCKVLGQVLFKRVFTKKIVNVIKSFHSMFQVFTITKVVIVGVNVYQCTKISHNFSIPIISFYNIVFRVMILLLPCYVYYTLTLDDGYGEPSPTTKMIGK